jgi:hypothetical protein
MARLGDLVSVMRSKNAGPFQVTIDLMFPEAAPFHRVARSGVLTPERIATLYRAKPAEVQVIPFERVLAIKITVPRRWGVLGSGSAGDRDVYGAQQHGPLVGLEIP